MIRFKKARLPSELAVELHERTAGIMLGDLAESLDERRLLLEQWGLEDIAAEPGRCGAAGSPTRVQRIQAIVLKKEGFSEIAPTEDGVRQLVHELVIDHTLG
jgi:electron transfer flavoprotein alpha/beta subunit